MSRNPRYARATFVLILVLGIAAGLVSRAEGGKSFGKGVGGSETVRIGDLLGDPGKYVGKTVRVSGKITDVCTHAGCWIDIQDEREGKVVRFKVRDGVIVFPVDVKNKEVVAEGVLEKLELSKDDAIAQARHEAEESGKKFDPASITGPTVQYRIAGTGAVVR
jgi:hypothetical protein